ncbi:15080_t:CDS:2 [Cetraspora pellucida]|uniref:15080_t:CDS:1 n=1 Tax=Cetraspora pellucida TaxID=1433469 RepID=A0A9N8ZC44_9GLOM|nr:15080_t:CDS:2 [Cetraspora pellucida]
MRHLNLGSVKVAVMLKILYNDNSLHDALNFDLIRTMAYHTACTLASFDLTTVSDS